MYTEQGILKFQDGRPRPRCATLVNHSLSQYSNNQDKLTIKTSKARLLGTVKPDQEKNLVKIPPLPVAQA